MVGHQGCVFISGLNLEARELRSWVYLSLHTCDRQWWVGQGWEDPWVLLCGKQESGRRVVSLVHGSSDLHWAGAERPSGKGPLLSHLFAAAIFPTPGTSLFHSLSWLRVRGTEGFLFLGEISMSPGLFLGYQRHRGPRFAVTVFQHSLEAQSSETQPALLTSVSSMRPQTHPQSTGRETHSLPGLQQAGAWSLSGSGRKLPLLSARTGCHLKSFRDVSSRHLSHTANLWKAVLWLAFVIQSPFQPFTGWRWESFLYSDV